MGLGRVQHGSKVGRKSVQNGSLEAPGRALGGSWAALGGPWGAKADFRAMLGALGDPFWGLENAEKTVLKAT